jgi:hypothetical protein
VFSLLFATKPKPTADELNLRMQSVEDPQELADEYEVLNKITKNASTNLPQSHELLLKVSKYLNPADKGLLHEQFYHKIVALDRNAKYNRLVKAGKLKEAEALRKAPLTDQVELMDGTVIRRPDMVDGNTVVEVKSTNSRLSARDIAQQNDTLKAIANLKNNETLTLTKNGQSYEVTEARLVFTDVRGFKGSQGQLEEWLDNYNFLTVEVFDSNGVRHLLKQNNFETLMPTIN